MLLTCGAPEFLLPSRQKGRRGGERKGGRARCALKNVHKLKAGTHTHDNTLATQGTKLKEGGGRRGEN